MREEKWACLLLTLFVLAIPSAYLCWNGLRRPRSRLRLHGLYVAWCVIVCFPFVMAVAYLSAGGYAWMAYPNYPHTFRWGQLAREAGGGLLAAFLLGNFFAAFDSGPQESAPAVPAFPEVGNRWSDRPGGKSSSESVHPFATACPSRGCQPPHVPTDPTPPPPWA
jgi:hypothetical protein